MAKHVQQSKILNLYKHTFLPNIAITIILRNIANYR